VGLVRLLFSFKGRINRAQYWLSCIGVGFAAGITIFALAISTGAQFIDANNNPAGALQALASFGLLFGLIMLVMSWCGYAIQVKRFHDRGQSGKWALLPFLPMFGIMSTLFSGAMSGATPEHVAASMQPYMLASMLISFGFFINLGCLAGTNGPNKYGDPPGSSGGGYTAPSPTPPAPGARAPTNAAGAANAMFGSAQAAMDRAIAEKARSAATAAPAQPQPRPSAPMTPAPAGGGSFGRRVR
jgi:uncharacterized membrane protein YhaH (DUF805 family)